MARSQAAAFSELMTDYHESWDALPDTVRDHHRALTSLKEEIEAIDWYHQRVALCTDPELAKVLAHNRDEEIEHACLTLEWLRRRMPGWQEQLTRYVFTESSISELADEEEAAKPKEQRPMSLPIGNLKR
jgi:uncharacterized protein